MTTMVYPDQKIAEAENARLRQEIVQQPAPTTSCGRIRGVGRLRRRGEGVRPASRPVGQDKVRNVVRYDLRHDKSGRPVSGEF